MKAYLALGAAIATAALATATTSGPAHAIRCDGIVQVNKYTRIITPYCQHEEMARIAREYGIKTSGHKLRNNINYKARICEFIGHDTRLMSICGGLGRDSRGGRRFPS